MIVLVCGGRDYQDRRVVFDTLDRLHEREGVSLLIEGGARGADRFAREWAQERGCPYRTFCAQWKKYGKSAGPIRNAEMLRFGKPQLLVAFPGGAGTENMIDQANAAGVDVLQPIPIEA